MKIDDLAFKDGPALDDLFLWHEIPLAEESKGY
jgi:hypothetical protein